MSEDRGYIGARLTQPTETLDLAWDRFMERQHNLGPQGEGVQPDWLMSLAQRGVEPFEISQLFDIAITAYKEGRE